MKYNSQLLLSAITFLSIKDWAYPGAFPSDNAAERTKNPYLLLADRDCYGYE